VINFLFVNGIFFLKTKIMGYIKEPDGIDLNISPMPYTEETRRVISAAIAEYKRTGIVPKSVPISTLKTKAKRKYTRKKVEISKA
jgi:hypothetical protein